MNLSKYALLFALAATSWGATIEPYAWYSFVYAEGQNAQGCLPADPDGVPCSPGMGPLGPMLPAPAPEWSVFLPPETTWGLRSDRPQLVEFLVNGEVLPLSERLNGTFIFYAPLGVSGAVTINARSTVGAPPGGSHLRAGNFQVYDANAPIPEPATLLLTGAPLVALGLARRRFRHHSDIRS